MKFVNLTSKDLHRFSVDDAELSSNGRCYAKNGAAPIEVYPKSGWVAKADISSNIYCCEEMSNGDKVPIWQDEIGDVYIENSSGERKELPEKEQVLTLKGFNTYYIVDRQVAEIVERYSESGEDLFYGRDDLIMINHLVYDRLNRLIGFIDWKCM